MPKLHILPPEGTLQYQRNVSFEDQVGSWLLKSGWQVFYPKSDHGHKTDLVVSNGPNFYRIQVKTLVKPDSNQVVQNKWQGSLVDYVVYFVHEKGFGYVVRAFENSQMVLSRTSHVRFNASDVDFCRAFQRI